MVPMDHDQNLPELSMNMISRFTICVNRELCEWLYSTFNGILSENWQILAWFYMKSLKFCKSGVSRISQFRNEVNCDSLKH